MITDALLAHKYFGSGVLAHSYYPRRKFIAHGSALSLCNLILKKSMFYSAGGFNPRIGYGGEDTELLYLLQKIFKATLLYDPTIYVYHKKRKFGLAYFRQRFLFRVKNGKLIYAYPELYLSNKKFLLFMVSVTIALILLFINQFLFLIGLSVYLTALVVTSLPFARRDIRIFLLLPPLLLVQHSIYYFGVVVGLLHGFNYTQLKKARRL